MIKAVARVLFFLSALPSPTEPCDVCDGIASRKVNSGEVLEINDAGLERLAPAHSMLAILLYKPYDAKTERMQRAFDDVASALKADGLLDKCVLAQIDAIEARGIDPADVSPTYWRTLGNRLAARLPLPDYSAERHAAWLAGRALR